MDHTIAHVPPGHPLPILSLVLCALLLFMTGCTPDDAAADAAQQNLVASPHSAGAVATAISTPTTIHSPTHSPTVAQSNAAQPTMTVPNATSTPLPKPVQENSTPTKDAEFAPAPAPIGTVTYYTTTVTLPTYPYEKYQTNAVDPATNWPYQKFDQERFKAEEPIPEPRNYLALVLENVYLRMTILPQLGGRIWQVEHKQSGNRMFYQNTVVKPSPWGPGQQLGWLALGGLEWNLPVIEHGYDWGTEWGYIPNQHSPDLVTVTVFTPGAGRALNGSITITLRSGAASFEIEPLITNLSGQEVAFDYWHDAMLAPGPRNQPSDLLRFILPGDAVTVHSTGDTALPPPGERIAWPVYNGRDLSTLGNWGHYLGFFESPAAHGPFAGVYDVTYDAGAVRVFPAEVARGSKVFALGWRNALASDNYTDDGSAYVELHGGLTPTFFEQYHLPPGGAVTWREVWYPIQNIGGLTVANEVAALSLTPAADGLSVGLYPTRPLDGALVAIINGTEVARVAVDASPNVPFTGQIATRESTGDPLEIRVEDSAGRVLLRYTK